MEESPLGFLSLVSFFLTPTFYLLTYKQSCRVAELLQGNLIREQRFAAFPGAAGILEPDADNLGGEVQPLRKVYVEIFGFNLNYNKINLYSKISKDKTMEDNLIYPPILQ